MFLEGINKGQQKEDDIMARIYANIFFKEDIDIVDCLEFCKELKTNRLIKNVYCSATFEKPHQTTTRIEIDEEILAQPYPYGGRSKKRKEGLKRLALVSLTGSKNENIRKSALKYLARINNPIRKNKGNEKTFDSENIN